AEEVNARIRACKDSGLDYATSSDEFGCENVTCRSMPQQAQGRPQECRESYNPATGLTTIECGRQGCAPYSDPENIAGQKYKCVEAGGKPVLEKDSSGCERLNCKFPEGEAAEREKQPLIGAADCPPDEAIERIIEGCRNRGYTPNVSKNLGGCTSVECVPHVVSCPTDSLEGLRKNRADCEASGGRVVQAFGPTGCQSNVCVPEGRVKEVCKGIPREAYGKCEGNKFIVEVDEEDCLVFFECLDRKEGAIEAPGEIKKMPGVTQLRATVRKLEGLKAELHNFAVKADRLAEYYESVGNISGAERYRRIALLYRAAMGRVEEVNRMLGDNAESMDEETLKGLKEDLRATKRVIGDIPYLMHSSEQEFGELTGEVLDCGSDPECLTNAFSNCQKAVIEQKSGEAFMQAEIKGLEGNRCVFVITARMGNETYTTTCKLDYLFAHPSQEDLQRDCEGDTDALFGQVRITSVQASIRPEEEVMRGMPVEETRSGVPMGEGMSDEEAKRAMEEEAMKKAMEGQG
ncbi:hypothetical protein KJ891_00715, partial [Candidatus Micrarchaeota archaeon]|nr:hypothetical protein [Candidatus Micrarchaeota archaeon]